MAKMTTQADAGKLVTTVRNAKCWQESPNERFKCTCPAGMQYIFLALEDNGRVALLQHIPFKGEKAITTFRVYAANIRTVE